MPALIAVFLGLALGVLCGGSLRRVAHLRLRFEWLLLTLFVLQGIARGRLPGLTARASGAPIWVWVLISLALTLVLVANRSTPGALIAAAGILMNVMVVTLNLGMPVGRPTTFQTEAASGGFYHAVDPATLFAWLGDSMRVGGDTHALWVSPGDAALAVGVVVMLVGVMIQGTSSDHSERTLSDW